MTKTMTRPAAAKTGCPKDAALRKIREAEAALEDFNEDLRTPEEVAAFAARVASRAYLKRWHPELNKPIDVRTGRKADADENGITIPPKARDKVTILHELAHTVTIRMDGHPDHGPHFARVFGNMVGNVLGQDAWKALKTAYRDKGVEVSAFNFADE